MQLSPPNAVRLPQGTIFYHDQGAGQPIVFVHGLLANSNLWCYSIADLSADFRCVAPDLPLGAHTQAVNPEADLTPLGVAKLVADFLAALDLHDVTLVGNDTGGAIAQIVVAHYPERVGRLVLFNVDAFENFLPPLFRGFQWIARIPGGVFAIAQLFRPRLVQRLTLALLSQAGTTRDVVDTFFRRFIDDSAVRRDVGKLLRTISNRYTLDAATRFGDFHKPVLLPWGADDMIFTQRYAERLRDAFPNAELLLIPNARTFVQLDQPARLAQAIRAFIQRGSTVGAPASRSLVGCTSTADAKARAES